MLRAERGHVHLLAGGSFGARGITQPGRGRVEQLPIGEGADHAGSSADLFHDPLEGIVGPDLDPVAVREGVVGPRLADAFLDQFGRSGHRLASQLADHRVRLVLGRVPALLGVDGLEHVGHLAHVGRGLVAEYIAAEMQQATLLPCIGEGTQRCSPPGPGKHPR